MPPLLRLVLPGGLLLCLRRGLAYRARQTWPRRCASRLRLMEWVMLRVRVLAASMLAAAAVVVAACGGSGSTSGRPSSSVSPTLTLGQEYPAMKAAARAATSVAGYGAVLVEGRRGNPGPDFDQARAARCWG